MRVAHKVCTVPYPNCIVVPSINNNEPREYRVRSPSPPPSPKQPGRSLLALLEARRHDPPPSRRSNTPSASVSQPHAASRPARSPLLRPLVVHLYGCSGRHICGRHRGWDIHAHGADRLHAQRQSRGPKKGALRRLRHTPVRTRRSATLPFDRFDCLWHIRDIWMGSAHDFGLASNIRLCNIVGV